jgi:hypothetical protein
MVSEEALRYATKRIEDFVKVHKGESDKEEALNIMFNSIGFDEDIRPQLFEWLDSFAIWHEDSSVLLGFLLGLFVLQYYRDEYGIQTV